MLVLFPSFPPAFYKSFYFLSSEQDLKAVVSTQKSLRELLVDAAPLREMMEKLSPLPIIQMRLSDRFSKVSY